MSGDPKNDAEIGLSTRGRLRKKWETESRVDRTVSPKNERHSQSQQA